MGTWDFFEIRLIFLRRIDCLLNLHRILMETFKISSYIPYLDVISTIFENFFFQRCENTHRKITLAIRKLGQISFFHLFVVKFCTTYMETRLFRSRTPFLLQNFKNFPILFPFQKLNAIFNLFAAQNPSKYRIISHSVHGYYLFQKNVSGTTIKLGYRNRFLHLAQAKHCICNLILLKQFQKLKKRFFYSITKMTLSIVELIK